MIVDKHGKHINSKDVDGFETDKHNQAGDADWFEETKRHVKPGQILVDLSNHPTISRYSVDDTRFRVIVGPVGSGKSVGAGCLEVFTRALAQEPSCEDNIRYVKAIVVRNTMTSLRKTTWTTWKGLFGHLPGIRETNLIHHIQIPAVEDSPGLDLRVEFIGLDRPIDEEKLLSLECTYMWFNEVKTIQKRIIDMASGRTGRYPSKMNGGAMATWSGIFCDTNPYSTDHWLAKIETQDIEGVTIYKQPPAVLEMERVADGWYSVEPDYPLHIDHSMADKWITSTASTFYAVNPGAENLKYLRCNREKDPRGKGSYYSDLIVNKEKEWIQMYAQVKNVSLSDDKLVIPDFKPSLMVSRDIEFDPKLPLLGGIDFGSSTLWPALIFGQRDPMTGGWIILDEVCATESIGLKLFIDQVLIMLQQKFFKRSSLQIFGDPAGHARDGIDMKSYFDHALTMGLRIDPAPTNQVGMRIESIRSPMTRMYQGRPNFLVHPRCEILIQALSSRWCYSRIQVSGEARYSEAPNKLHPYSDAADALSYLLSGGGEYLSLTVRNGSSTLNGDGLKPFVMSNDFNIFD